MRTTPGWPVDCATVLRRLKPTPEIHFPGGAFAYLIRGARSGFGRTASGRATVIVLRLNDLIAVVVRQGWVAAGWHPPEE